MPQLDHVAQPSALSRAVRSRGVRITAATVAAGLAVGAIATAGGGVAGAAATPRAQSVGRFLDGTTGGMALQSLADLKDARAKAAPNTSQRNPLDANLFDAADIPIGDGLKLPGGGVFEVGAANQIAVAKTNGYSYGAAGAVDNTGGAQLTDNSGSYPSDGTINLSGAALGSTTIPGLPALPGLPAGTPIDTSTLGGVVAKVGAVQALAQTETGGKIVTPQSSVADLQLAIGSPALGALLTQLKTVFNDNLGSQTTGALGSILGALPGGGSVSLPSDCALTTPSVKPISLEDGGVVIDADNATITVDLKILLEQLLGVDISHLTTSNFDLTKFLVQKLPTILSKGLENVVTSLTQSLNDQFQNCVTALAGDTALSSVLNQLTSALTGAQGQLTSAINSLADPLISSSASPLATLADGLTNVADIGLNVQSGPKVQPRNQDYKYTSQLANTPDQATSVVKGQSLVRAIEIDLLDAAGSAGTGGGLPTSLPSLPGTSAQNARQLAGAKAAAAGSAPVSIALANAAAGPSTTPTSTPTTAAPASNAPTTELPTGVPAGAAGHDDGGSPLLPIGLVLLGLVVAGGGVLSLKSRGRFSR